IAIYAGVDDALWREDAPLPMASPYPMTAYKKVCEVYGQYYALRMQMSVVSLRIAAFGPLQRSLHFLPARLAHAAVKGVPGPELRPDEALPYEDDACDLSYIADTADAMARVQLAPALRYSTYNIGGGRSLTNRELADAVGKAVPGAQFRFQRGTSGARFPPLDISRLKEDVGWTPRYTIERGMAEYVSWLRDGHSH